MKKQPQQPKGGEVRPQARIHDVVVQELPEEVLAYDLKTHKAYCLNKTAAAVWKQCDGQKTIEDITTLLAQETDAQISNVEVRLALYQLGKANLLERCASFSAEETRQSRREILRRIGLGAAALPLVTFIIAPSAVHAQSCGGGGQNTVGCPCSAAANCASNCCGFGNICANTASVPIGNGCRANCECANNCCGFGNICANTGSVPSGGSCRVDCECSSGNCLSSSPRKCA